MKWYKIIKLLIELLTFGLCTYEKFEKEESPKDSKAPVKDFEGDPRN